MDGFLDVNHLEQEDTEEIILLKQQIDDLRSWGCHNVANLLCDELKELRQRK
jgi:hypothetical protein